MINWLKKVFSLCVFYYKKFKVIIDRIDAWISKWQNRIESFFEYLIVLFSIFFSYLFVIYIFYWIIFFFIYIFKYLSVRFIFWIKTFYFVLFKQASFFLIVRMFFDFYLYAKSFFYFYGFYMYFCVLFCVLLLFLHQVSEVNIFSIIKSNLVFIYKWLKSLFNKNNK